MTEKEIPTLNEYLRDNLFFNYLMEDHYVSFNTKFKLVFVKEKEAEANDMKKVRRLMNKFFKGLRGFVEIGINPNKEYFDNSFTTKSSHPQMVLEQYYSQFFPRSYNIKGEYSSKMKLQLTLLAKMYLTKFDEVIDMLLKLDDDAFEDLVFLFHNKKIESVIGAIIHLPFLLDKKIPENYNKIFYTNNFIISEWVTQISRNILKIIKGKKVNEVERRKDKLERFKRVRQLAEQDGLELKGLLNEHI